MVEPTQVSEQRHKIFMVRDLHDLRIKITLELSKPDVLQTAVNRDKRKDKSTRMGGINLFCGRSRREIGDGLRLWKS